MLCAKHTAAGLTTDFKTGAVDKVPLAPLDWSARIHVVNGNPHAKPYPVDRMFWIVTEGGDAYEVAYDREATFWCSAEHGPYFSRQDGEPGCWSAEELAGWSDNHEDAEEAAALFARIV